MKLTQHVQNIFPTLRTSLLKGIRIQTKPKTEEKHDHAQTRSFAMIHWCFPYDMNYCAGFQVLEFFESFQVFESLLLFDIVWKWDILMGNENHVSTQLCWDALWAGFSPGGRGLFGATRGRRPLTSSVYLQWPAVKHWVHFSRWCWRSLPLAQ